jgi:hypothetical protein
MTEYKRLLQLNCLLFLKYCIVCLSVKRCRNCVVLGSLLGLFVVQSHNNNNNNSMPLVRERTIPSERTPLVGEVSANFLRIKGVA